MHLFFYPSELGVKALIENHFWKYEFTMDNLDLYSGLMNNGHVLLSLHKRSNLVCIYPSIIKYKLQSFSNLVVVPEFSLGNGIYSFKGSVMDIEGSQDEDEDDIYDCYDAMSTLCKPSHKLYFNMPVLYNYDWSVLRSDVDFKLLQLDEKQFSKPFYISKCSQYIQLLCNRKTAHSSCKHNGRKMTNISGGYKNLLFSIKTDKGFKCPCSIFKFLNEYYNSVKFNYVMFSYKLTQFFLNG